MPDRYVNDPAFQEAVAKATSAAAFVATDHLSATLTWRRRITDVLLAVIASACIALPVAYFVPQAAERERLHEAAHALVVAERNCADIGELAHLGKVGLAHEREETKEFEKNSHDRLGLTQTKFEELVHRQQQRQAERQVILERVVARTCE